MIAHIHRWHIYYVYQMLNILYWMFEQHLAFFWLYLYLNVQKYKHWKKVLPLNPQLDPLKLVKWMFYCFIQTYCNYIWCQQWSVDKVWSVFFCRIRSEVAGAEQWKTPRRSLYSVHSQAQEEVRVFIHYFDKVPDYVSPCRDHYFPVCLLRCLQYFQEAFCPRETLVCLTWGPDGKVSRRQRSEHFDWIFICLK